jgi:hypothetical protein
MAKMLYTAIVFMVDKSPVRKYRNITNIVNFTNFARSIDAEYFNLYEKVSKTYIERIYIKKGE